MPASATRLRQLKILLLGDTATGKHCYMKRLIENKFPNDAWTNKECDISSIRVSIDQYTTVPVQIFNIRGTERGKSRIKKYFKNIDGYMIMFDVTQPESYDNVIGWKTIVDAENKSVQLPCIVLANKCDLEKEEGVMNQMEQIDSYCEVFHFRAHFETSSKDNIAIQQSFQYLIREIIERPVLQTSEPSSHPRSLSTTSEPYSDSSATSKAQSRSSTISEPDFRPSSSTALDPNIRRLSPPPTQDTILKILVIGDLGTGKTSVIQRYVNHTFSGHYRTTIGADIAYKKLPYNNDLINIHIWDIAGDERFGAMTHLFYRNAVGCLIVFDVSKPLTLDGAARWKNDFDDKVNYDENNQIPCVLVGNKCDLEKQGDVKDERHMIDFCHTRRFNRWFQTSAKQKTNIDEVFTFLIDQIMGNANNRTEEHAQLRARRIIIDDAASPSSADHGCCNI